VIRSNVFSVCMALVLLMPAAGIAGPDPGALRAAPAGTAPPAANRAVSAEELEKLRLQSLMNKQKKVEETASGVVKKQNDTTSSVRSNVK
jgi:hypothetical protein